MAYICLHQRRPATPYFPTFQIGATSDANATGGAHEKATPMKKRDVPSEKISTVLNDCGVSDRHDDTQVESGDPAWAARCSTIFGACWNKLSCSATAVGGAPSMGTCPRPSPRRCRSVWRTMRAEHFGAREFLPEAQHPTTTTNRARRLARCRARRRRVLQFLTDQEEDSP